MSSFLSFEPEVAADFISEWEGFSEMAYKCPAGVWTVGYGHTLNVSAGDRITREEARKVLIEDIVRVACRLAPFINAPVNRNQYIALVSLGFNVGPDYVLHHCPKLMQALNAKRYDDCAEEFLDITRAGGKVLPGLVKRRQAEYDLFAGGSE